MQFLDTESKLERARAILKQRIPYLEQEHEKIAKLAMEEKERGDKSVSLQRSNF